MAIPVLPIMAIAALALFRKKKRSRSRAILVVKGESAKKASVSVGERLSIQFYERPGETWEMIDPPDSFLLGTTKLQWEPTTGDISLKTFDFEAKRPGGTEAVFSKLIDGQQETVSRIEIEVH